MKYILSLILIMLSYNIFSSPNDIEIGFKNLKLVGNLKRINKKDGDYKKSNCQNWNFKDATLKNLLKKMQLVSSSDWNLLCYTYPCSYEGVVENESIRYKIIVNGASHIKLIGEKETLYFINRKKSIIFITPCNCCE